MKKQSCVSTECPNCGTKIMYPWSGNFKPICPECDKKLPNEDAPAEDAPAEDAEKKSERFWKRFNRALGEGDLICLDNELEGEIE